MAATPNKAAATTAAREPVTTVETYCSDVGDVVVVIGGDDDVDAGVLGAGNDSWGVDDGDDDDGVRGFDGKVVVVVVVVVAGDDDSGGVGDSCSNICSSNNSSDGADVEDGGCGGGDDAAGDVERVDEGIVAENGVDVEADGDVQRKCRDEVPDSGGDGVSAGIDGGGGGGGGGGGSGGAGRRYDKLLPSMAT